MPARRVCLHARVLLLLVFPAALLAPARAHAKPAVPPPPAELRVDFIDVGQGDATLITTPAGKRVLIDGGPGPAGQALASFVCPRGAAPLDLVLLTHRHADHLGGLHPVIKACGARLYMDAPYPHPSPAYAALLRLIEARGIPVRQAQRGRDIDLGGGARLTLLSPPDPQITGSRSDVNSNSVVARLAYGKVTVLFTGDAEAPTETWLLSAGVMTPATVLKVAHHGSRYSSTARFLKVVRPEVAVISLGADNGYGHPGAQTLDRLRKIGARVYRTDSDGRITLTTDGQRYQIVTASGRAELARTAAATAGANR